MKMIIMQGLPASGKTTRAQEIMKADGNAVRINKDLLRTMLHFDRFTGRNEGMTRDAARVLALHFLQAGKNVIIDDTNLNPGTLQSWVDLAKGAGARIQYERLDTPYTECLARDAARSKPVGRHVILGMALRYRLYHEVTSPVIICDLDGTLADISHRLHFVKPPAGLKEGDDYQKDWDSFFAGIPNDTPRAEVVAMLQKYAAQDREIFFVSGRPDSQREATERWLETAWPAPYAALLMRQAHDKRPDTEVKAEIYHQVFEGKIPVHLVIDDRPSVIRMWRGLGLEVVDVGSGVEF